MGASEDTGDFARLRELFDRIVATDASAREALIRTACGGDERFERELRALLDAHERESGNTGSRRDDMLGAGREALAQAASPGERVGPFVLREVLGRGGMGVVYRAERVDGEVKQQVAVKVLQRMHLDEAGVRRFAQERDIVAQLAHPYIARLFDAGTTRDGFPYYALELIEGEPIADWCAARNAPIDIRLELFLKVCDAVRFAHANLVLHRDIKPANVLVDASGTPKLIDFGIAKTMTAADATQTGLQLFSPSNAAPEQLRGERCGVACDVYQLGTLLYELLAGATVLGDNDTSPAAIEAAILHMVPTLPSELLARRGDPAATAVRGDLDTIALRALRKEPDQRYASVEQLADEVRRYLRDEPLVARGSERAYRFRKFLRRNRAALAAGTAIAALLATVVMMQVVQSQRLERERDAARAERNRAQVVSSFLTNLFRNTNPGASLAPNLTAADLLQRGRERIDEELADQPEMRLPLLGTLAIIHTAMGDQVTASRMIDNVERSLAEGVRIDDRGMATLLWQIGTIRKGDGDMDAATAAARRALEIQARLGDSASARWPARLLLMAELQKKDRSQWKPYILGMLAELEADSDVDPVMLATVRVELGHNFEFTEDFELGERLIRQGLSVLEAKLPSNEYRVLSAYSSLGSMLVAMGRGAEALPYLEELVRRGAALNGADSAIVARARNHLGRALASVGRDDEALAQLRQAADVLRKVGPFPQGPLMVALDPLGNVELKLRHWADAEAHFREAVEIADATGGKRGSNALETRYGLARALSAQRKWPESVAVLAECEPLVSWTLAADAKWAVAYAEALLRSGRRDEVGRYLDRAAPLIAQRPDLLAEAATKSGELRAELAR